MKKVREFLQRKAVRVSLMACTVATALASVAGAAEGDSTAVTAAFTTGFGQMKTDALAMIAIIVPIALGIAGVIFLARKAIGWFKSLAK